MTRHLPPGSTDVLEGHALVQRPDDVAYTSEELREAVAGADAVVCVLTDRIDAAVIAAAPSLRAVGNVAVGFDNVDIDAATAAGVAVCNTPGVLDETTADLAFALVLAASRLLGSAEAEVRTGRWTGWELNGFLGRDVHGATLGIVGYGRIGKAVARRCAGFGMNVLHHSRRDSGSHGYVEHLDTLLSEADVVSLHVPLTSETYHLIDRRRLALMKDSCVLVNTARGKVVDELALAEALEEGRLFAAGLDVYEHEPEVHPRLLAAPRTVLLPHVGSATVATRTTMARMACSSVAQALRGEHPANILNPQVLA